MKSECRFIVSCLVWFLSLVVSCEVASAGPGGSFNVLVGGLSNQGAAVVTYPASAGNVANPGPAGINLIPMKQKMAFVSLESLEAEYFPASKIVSVKGSLKNISSSSLRGYITISLLSQSGVVLTAFDMQVNDHRPFLDGETIAFDTAVNVSSVSGAFRVSVEFTKD